MALRYMSQTSANSLEYRGYRLDPSSRGPVGGCMYRQALDSCECSLITFGFYERTSWLLRKRRRLRRRGPLSVTTFWAETSARAALTGAMRSPSLWRITCAGLRRERWRPRNFRIIAKLRPVVLLRRRGLPARLCGRSPIFAGAGGPPLARKNPLFCSGLVEELDFRKTRQAF
jgi:hypothetical protein